MRRYVINCSKCGRFVGKDGFHDYSPESNEIGYPLCGECLKKRGPTIYDLEVELKELRKELLQVRGEGNPLRKRIKEIEQQIKDRKERF